MPPTTSMVITSNVRLKSKVLGEKDVRKWANNEPAIAVRNALTTNATSRERRIEIPTPCAAHRSPRCANIWRPKPERLMRHTT